MRWVVIAIVATACWRGNEPEPVQPTAPPAAKLRPVADIPLPCESFDPANPNCRTTCLTGAPDDWPGCIAARDKMLAQGFNCPGPSWRSCTPPPPLPPPPQCAPCPPVTARIVGLSATATGTRIMIAAGANQGVTKVWTAHVLDANNTPVAGGAVAILRVDRPLTVGEVTLTVQQLQGLRFVRLQP